jgi:NTE family protein
MVLGIVLSGGGARGAYEAGVLAEMGARFSCRLRGAILAGTSAGAFNAAYLGSRWDHWAEAAAGLANRWSQIDSEEIFRLGPAQVGRLPSVLLGGKGELGLLDTAPMAAFFEREIPWPALLERVHSGDLGALTVSTTHVATGRSVVFEMSASGPMSPHERWTSRHCEIGVKHVLASAAIPILFLQSGSVTSSIATAA